MRIDLETLDELLHPAHIAHRDKASKAGRIERFASSFADAMGTSGFLLWATVFITGWVALNLLGFIAHWDPYPFICLNLVFSAQAFYAAPLILMASKMSDAKRDAVEAYDHEAIQRIEGKIDALASRD